MGLIEKLVGDIPIVMPAEFLRNPPPHLHKMTAEIRIGRVIKVFFPVTVRPFPRHELMHVENGTEAVLTAP